MTMAYADVQPMLDDTALQARVKGCVLEQAGLKDVSTDPLASFTLAQPDPVTVNFMYYFGADQALVGEYASGGQAAIADGAILSKAQTVWDDVAYVLHLAV